MEPGKLIINDREWFKKKCIPAVCLDEIAEICGVLKETLDANPTGVGIAANQMGYNKRIAVIRHGGKDLVLVNPIVHSRSPKTTKSVEGCLSFPHAQQAVRRNKTITISVTEDSEPQEFTGMKAIIIQHEIDHLDGKTMWDRPYSNGVRGTNVTPKKKKRKKRRK